MSWSAFVWGTVIWTGGSYGLHSDPCIHIALPLLPLSIKLGMMLSICVMAQRLKNTPAMSYSLETTGVTSSGDRAVLRDGLRILR